MRHPGLLLLPLLLVAALAGCGGSAARSDVNAAQTSLADLTRATLHLKLALRTTPHPTGVQVDGPFSVAPGEGPLADVVVRRPGEKTIHLRLDGMHGTMRTGAAKPVPLSPFQLLELGAAISPRSTRGIATYIQAGKWVTHPKLVRRGGLDRVTGGVELSRVARDLLEIAGASGYGVPQLSGGDLDRLDSLVGSSSFDLTETHADHVLRRLAIHFALKPEARTDPVARLLGTDGTLVLALDHVGEPVHVRPS